MEQREQRREKLERIESFVLEKVKTLDSERYDVLIGLKTNRPRAYRHLMMRSGKALRMADKDPGIAQRFLRAIDLTAEMGNLADGFDTLSPAQQSRRRAKMNDVAAEMFDLKQEGQRARLAAMEARLEKARKELEAKQAAKDKIVQDMVHRILTPKSERQRRPR